MSMEDIMEDIVVTEDHVNKFMDYKLGENEDREITLGEILEKKYTVNTATDAVFKENVFSPAIILLPILQFLQENKPKEVVNDFGLIKMPDQNNMIDFLSDIEIDGQKHPDAEKLIEDIVDKTFGNNSEVLKESGLTKDEVKMGKAITFFGNMSPLKAGTLIILLGISPEPVKLITSGIFVIALAMCWISIAINWEKVSQKLVSKIWILSAGFNLAIFFSYSFPSYLEKAGMQ